MKHARLLLTMVFLMFGGGCGGGGDDDAGTAIQAVGTTHYDDAATDHDGTAQQPAGPPAQDASIKVIVEGSGDIPQIDPQCALDPVGQFEARYTGTATLDGDGAYASTFAAVATQLVTPSGCAIPELTVGVISDVKVRAELATSTENCTTYCAAFARASAEQSCGASADQATCRGDAEAEVEASCTTDCTTRADVIVAEVSLGATALGSLDAGALRGGALGTFEAELVFDHLEP